MPRTRDSTPRSVSKQTGQRHQVQTLFRLWNDDRDKLLLKLQMDGTNLQRILNVLVLEYLADNPVIMKIVREQALRKGMLKVTKQQRDPSFFNENDTKELLKRIELESPLQDKEIVPR